jgi:hypothetical protein
LITNQEIRIAALQASLRWADIIVQHEDFEDDFTLNDVVKLADAFVGYIQGNGFDMDEIFPEENLPEG